ncbi:MAG: heme ABC exporter ATP-binding protein CcmA [Gammaproteobacteria bacterium]
MSALLSFADLTIVRGDRVLLRGVRGQVAAGEILHLRGANGIGKTSLLEVLIGLRAPEAGAVTRAFEPEQCHWVGHRNALNAALSPFENLRFWCAIHGAPADGLRAALREFELSRVADQPCRQLSAGQKRRAALARLAVVRRPLWFLDEPLSALDEAGVRHWLNLLQAHAAQGGAAVITSHQPLPAPLPGLRTLELT